MLSAKDLHVIREQLGREPTALELACFENLWSEHCSYRSTKQLLKTLPTTGTDVLLGPGDDAAIVRFSDRIAIAVSMESHNHPSYVDPHDGAATGVGGIVRDVLSMGSRPIALMDPLYFGPLNREKNRYLMEHVVSGIGGYGNCIGVPVVRGDLVFDDSYDGNPLVNVICVGTVDPDQFITARVKRPGSHLILFGASTGRDGLGGASFASRDLGAEAEALDRPSVQIGDPYTEKLLIDATLAMAETGKVLSCRDLGAAGLAGASSEMCSTFGGKLHADRVHQREKGMTPVEIMLAESQERMLAEIAPEDVSMIGNIAQRFDLKWSDIGEVIREPRYIIEFHGKVVCDLPIDFLSGGATTCVWQTNPYNVKKPFNRPGENLKSLVMQILSHPEVASKRYVYEQYDHDVQVRTISLLGDAALIRLDGQALSLSCGCNPRHCYIDPYAGSANSVFENASNLACVGGSPFCIVNCLNFASPVHPEISWQLEQCILGLGDAARKMGVPVVGGNVSLYNESDEFSTAIKPTPSIGMLGKGKMIRPREPTDGEEIALIGTTGPHFGGSVLDAVTACGGQTPPVVDELEVLSFVRERVETGGFTCVTDLSQGGLLAAIATLTPCARIVLEGDPIEELFSETYGRFLVTFRSESSLKGMQYHVIGETCGDRLAISSGQNDIEITDHELGMVLGSLSGVMQKSP